MLNKNEIALLKKLLETNKELAEKKRMSILACNYDCRQIEEGMLVISEQILKLVRKNK